MEDLLQITFFFDIFYYVIFFIQGSQLLDQFGKLDVDPEQFVLYKPFNGTLDNMTIPEGQK